jgi:hypothetical protein
MSQKESESGSASRPISIIMDGREPRDLMGRARCSADRLANDARFEPYQSRSTTVLTATSSANASSDFRCVGRADFTRP